MVKFKIALLAFILTGFSCVTFAQKSSLKLIAELPIHFGIGYEGQISKRFSVGSSVGLFTSPNSDIIIGYLRFLGTDENLLLIIEDAFQLGIVGEVNINYNIKRSYIGAFTQVMGVQASDASAALVEDYFDIDMNDYPLFNAGVSSTDKHLSFRTRLYQVGMLFGHRFPLKGDRFEIDVEMGLSANVYSKSKIYSEERDLSKFNDRFNEELVDYYRKYAFIPSIGVMLVYKLKPNEN
jgi:hypothetical protein